MFSCMLHCNIPMWHCNFPMWHCNIVWQIGWATWKGLQRKVYRNLRPFRLTHVIAHARVSTHTNLSAHEHTHKPIKPIVARIKSHIQLKKVLLHWIFFFQSFGFFYERHLWIMRYMSIAYRRRWLRLPERRPKRKIGFIWLFCVGFQFRFFFRTAQAYTVYYFKC